MLLSPLLLALQVLQEMQDPQGGCQELGDLEASSYIGKKCCLVVCFFVVFFLLVTCFHVGGGRCSRHLTASSVHLRDTLNLK